jgi:hypothetical protein
MRLVAARWRLRQRQDAAADLAAAEAALARGEALNPRHPDVLFTEGLVARFRAEAAAGGAERAALVETGLERVGKALAVNAGEGRYLALRGLFESMAARSEADPGRRQEGARRAVASLEAALKANPLLQREYGPALAAARLDAGDVSGIRGVRPRPAQL